jgi:hypothetical protein
MNIYKTLIFICLILLVGCENGSNEIISNDKIIEEKIIENEQWESIVKEDDETDFTKFIKKDFINAKQTNINKYGKEEIIYLGDIVDNNGNTLSHVLNLYSEVQAAIKIHRHSNIIFVHNNKKQIKRFDVGTQDELPYKLENNNLFFHYIDTETNKEKTFIDTIGMTLPKIICVAPENCY